MPKQFSLRLMLAVVTVLCITLTVWVIPSQRQRQAVNAIRADGGEVFYVSRTFLTRWLPQDYVDDVELVLLRRTRVTGDTLARLKSLPRLHILWLDGALITDAELVHLEGLTDLKQLSLEYTPITDAGLAHVHALTNLQRLWLFDSKVTDEGIARLRKALPNCKISSSP
ncbi:MAG TPA: hypothetical protein VHC22_29380 [Pirellulales bacterium]|nr:hypothetical protein [Pirellulales bacterium]